MKLRPGDVVEVRDAGEILATLDDDGTLDAMPFMPEMLRHAGKRFTVSRRVEKICDTVSPDYHVSRRMRDTVLLEDLRCDGSAHGGCQAGCRLYWKEAWLRRVDDDAPPPAASDNGTDTQAELRQLTLKGSRRAPRELDGAQVDVYRCQATEARRATAELDKYDPRQYLREVTSGNVGLLHFLRVAARGLSIDVRRRLGRLDAIPLPHQEPPTDTAANLHLKPGDTVQIRSPEEIRETLDHTGRTRGLSFDWEMIPYCGGSFRVQDRVQRIIDEGTGEMIELKSDCLILEGVTCSGERSTGRWFCPRAIYPYWREAWLSRVATEDAEPAEREGEQAGGNDAARDYSAVTSSST